MQAKQSKATLSVHFSEEKINRLVLYEEFRLVERNEHEIHSFWKGAQITIFFLAFVFGSFCTYCFHTLMHMFDNKCVLYPKVVSQSSIQLMVQELLAVRPPKEVHVRAFTRADLEPEVLSTHWSENSVCHLPTYVPLMSGLGGLVWATMFFMCAGASNVAGQRKHWRALPIVFLFSVAMALLCIYSSAVTHSGLLELCTKLAEATGGSADTFSINVATLVYSERRIRGVYQMTRLAISSAWLHSICWVLSALVVMARVVLAVDFALVSVKAELIGEFDKILQKYEDQINSMSPESSTTATPTRFGKDGSRSPKIIQFRLPVRDHESRLSLLPEEEYRLMRILIGQLLDELVEDVFEISMYSPGTLVSDTSKMAIEFVADFERGLTRNYIRKLLHRLVDRIVEIEFNSMSSSSSSSESSVCELKTPNDKSGMIEPVSSINPEEDLDKKKEKDVKNCENSENKIVIGGDIVGTASVRTLIPSNDKPGNNQPKIGGSVSKEEIPILEDRYSKDSENDYRKPADTASKQTLTPLDHPHHEAKTAVEKKKSDEIEVESEDKTKPKNEKAKAKERVNKDHDRDSNKPGPSNKKDPHPDRN